MTFHGKLSFFVLCCILILNPLAQTFSPVDKISAEIYAHQKEKSLPVGKSALQHKTELIKSGIVMTSLTSENCALYINNKLSSQEIAEYAKQGIIINENIYIPPVPGKHPHGFYLAEVPYNSLSSIEKDTRIVHLESADFASYPLNDVGGALINSDDVHSGNGVTAQDGSGVNIAVADSGIDLAHPDFPTPVETYDMTDGTDIASWDTNVSNTYTDHGTHVTGSVLGRGTQSSGTYKGTAPGANLYFYKIGNDVNGGSNDTDEIEALNRALTVGCDIFTMSYGGISTYMDGSSSMSQAIDSAVSSGMVVFISAGNEQNDDKHYSVSVAPSATSTSFDYTVSDSVDIENIRVIWQDGITADRQMALACSNLGAGESLTQAFAGNSSRGTEGKRYSLQTNTPGSSKTYRFTLHNAALSGTTPLVHLYRSSGKGTFDNPDASYTISNPALADSAIAVGAWCHRRSWTNYLGSSYTYSSWTEGQLAVFSSLGPRIDGTLKPDICTPGAAVISTRDSTYSTSTSLRIDNDGTNDGLPADYYLKQGTSMACPLAAGVGALLLDANPGLTPAQVKAAFTSTAANSGSPNNNEGYGLIDALAAVQLVLGAPTNTPTPTGTSTPTPGSPTPTPTGKPDLTLSAFGWSGTSVTEGSGYLLSPHVLNSGFSTAVASHVKLYLSLDNDFDTSDDYEVTPEKAVASLAPSATDDPVWSFNFPNLADTATYSVWPVFEIDSQGEVDEISENNTVKSTGSITVTNNAAAPTPTNTGTPTNTATNTPVPPTPTNTPVNTDTPTSTATNTPTNTPVPPTATNTPVNTSTPTSTATNTPVDTNTPTPTATNTPVDTNTPTPTATNTPVNTNTPTPTATNTPADTDTPTPTATNTPVDTNTPTATATNTPVNTDTPTATATNTPVDTDTPTPTITDTPTFTLTPTITSTPTVTSTPTIARPVVSLVVSATEGAAPLTITLIGSATDTDSPILQYMWSFENIGVTEVTESTSAFSIVVEATHTYDEPGEYRAVFRARDESLSMQNSNIVDIIVWTLTPTPSPTGTLVVPTNTPTPTATFTLTATHTPTATPTGSPTPPNKPDLVLAGVSVPGGTSTEGDSFFFQPTIRNTGILTAATSHAKLYLSIDNDLDTSDDYEVTPDRVVRALVPGAQARPQWIFTVPNLDNSDTYPVWPIFLLDSQDEVDESNEDNLFKFSASITVTNNPATPTPTNTATPTSTNTPTVTNTPAITNTPTSTNTPTITPTPTSGFPDLNGNGRVNIQDLLILFDAIIDDNTGGNRDVYHDGIMNHLDMLHFSRYWRMRSATPTPTPTNTGG
jgi:subtilisin family serine protease